MRSLSLYFAVCIMLVMEAYAFPPLIVTNRCERYSYDPEVIIIGGGISVREDLIDEINKRLDIIIDKVEPARIKPVVKKCAFANDANIIGAIYHYLTTSK